MIINLEGLANKLTNAMYDDAKIDEIEKAKIEYGFSLSLGIGIALAIALVLGALLGTFSYTLILTLSSLGLRLFSGGAHCSSYDRCLLFSLLIFVPASVLVKHLAISLDSEILTVVYIALAVLVLLYLFIKERKLAGLVLMINVFPLIAFYLIRKEFLPGPMFAVGTGILIQTLMLTAPGKWIVNKADQGMKFVGI